VVLRTVTDGGVTTTPPVNEPTVTVIVLPVVSKVTGLMITVAAAPGPVVVLQVRVTLLGVAVSRLTACMVPAKEVSASNERIARALWLFNAGKFMWTILFFEGFPHRTSKPVCGLIQVATCISAGLGIVRVFGQNVRLFP
jgi:hypothetical protein